MNTEKYPDFIVRIPFPEAVISEFTGGFLWAMY